MRIKPPEAVERRTSLETIRKGSNYRISHRPGNGRGDHHSSAGLLPDGGAVILKKEEIRMKHYRICIQAGRHEFEHLSSTISEAYGAIEDASIAFNLKIDMDSIMRVLVDLDRGNLIDTNRHPIRIRVEDGEV